MQHVHGLGGLAVEHQGQARDDVIDCGFDGSTILGRRSAEDTTQDEVFSTRVTDTDTYPLKVGSQVRDYIPQTVMTTMSTPLFEPHRPGRKIQFVVHDQNSGGFDLIELREGQNALPAAIHEGHGLKQPAIAPVVTIASHVAVKLGLMSQFYPCPVGKPIHPPEPGIVPGLCILRPRIPKTDN
jgi:hypothetical protein